MQPRSPRHDRAATFARSGLFNGLDCFAELERRIEQLPTEKGRGDAFEVFCEAFLSTDKMSQAEEVWVGGAIPREVKQQLNLPATDYGLDGVFRTKLGELVGYQAKFRSGRTALPYAELATFFGISEKADRRVLLTNAVAISAVAASRTDFQTTRGGDFDRLDAAQLAAIAAWIEGTPPLPLVREPRPYQHAALADIQAELVVADRATVIMACGTGKTLIALWAAEQARPNRVLVLVPSLNLLRQTLHEWAKWTTWGERFRYLCVCSDPTVTKDVDQIAIRAEDVDFPVRTDPAVVRQFLDQAADDVSVVFCTYQSAQVVGAAIEGRQSFDFGVFDEAHKTTGRDNTRYAFALRDESLPIRKRVFFTATPRHYDIRQRDKEGEFVVTSMDNKAIYGRVAHRLTFAKAAEQKIIVPYKVVISVVDSEMIDNALLDQSEVVIEGDPIRARWVAHQVALKRAVEEHDLKRIITFHSSIKAAAAFASGDSEGVGVHLPDFHRFHVSGAQTTAEREEHLRDFAEAQRGIITNARCLTEGVDVPSVDMVAFMNPRRSRVDIVQAVGRAMRTAGPEKTCGYILVPLFLESRKEEALDEALKRSEFDELAQVLNAMRDNDDDLNNVIEMLTVDRGRLGGFDESRLRERVDVLGPSIQLEQLTTAICTRLIDQIGITWDMRYGQLVSYKQTYGNCSVPFQWSDNPQLSGWCFNQRQNYKSKTLTPDRITRLERLGFVWDPLETAWEAMLAALIAYKQAHGDCDVPQHWRDNPGLGQWCGVQRRTYTAKTISPDRITRLEHLGFVWDLAATAWEEMFTTLTAYKETHGDCNVPINFKDSPKLGRWCSTQRRSYIAKTLSPDQITRLERVGFVWDQLGTTWEGMFAALTAYKEAHGDCNVARSWKDNAKLASWCGSQRYRHKIRALSADRVTKLENLGFQWQPYEVAWEKTFAALLVYKQAHGDCNVPMNSSLGRWCGTQRSSYKDNVMAPDRVERLGKLGFVWDQLEARWEGMFAVLTAYKEAHGDCNVPSEWPDNPQLANWCSNQRKDYRTKTLTPDRITRLELLGFLWDQLEFAWEEMLNALIGYKEAIGDCNVPQTWRGNPKLGQWCITQRQSYNNETLPLERITRLERLGFVWDLGTTAWEEMFAALLTYRQERGDCSVPVGWKDNSKLGRWCSTQRSSYTAKTLSPDRIMRLERLGFIWDPFGTAWEEMFTALNAYRKARGDCNVPKDWEDNPRLASWCGTQRASYRKETLSPARIARLEQLGFRWQPYEVAWEEMFTALTAYKAAHGVCDVPITSKDSPKLAVWCATQKHKFAAKTLSSDRTARLERIGFVWDPVETTWEEMFTALTAYKNTHGDCNVPQKWRGDPKLPNWCHVQRRNYRNNKLSPSLITRLERLGFVWHRPEGAWENMFAALVAYKETHGDCNVPYRGHDNPKLGPWCSALRRSYAAKTLSPERITRLERLGFVWDQRGVAWEEMFAALVAYKQKHGDCNVPVEWSDNSKLGRWCANQRQLYNKMTLLPNRIGRLEQLGFRFAGRGD